jgi:hypothetical protein
MTKRNKLIVGAVVVLGALYLYDRNRKMKELARLKAGAEVTPEVKPEPTPAPRPIARSRDVFMTEIV